MNQKEQQKAESRERILRAASELFREKGFHATGVDELMEKAGLTAGAFYAHFKSKQALLDETVRFTLERNLKLLLYGTENLKGRKYIDAVLSNYVNERHRDLPANGCPLPTVGPELPRHSIKASRYITEYLEGWIEMMESHLEGSSSSKRQEVLRLLSQAVGALLLSRLVEPELSSEILKSVK